MTAGHSDIIAVGIDKAIVTQPPRLQSKIGDRPATLFCRAIGTLDVSDLQDDFDAEASSLAGIDP
jgi:hypothetical protein